MSIPFVQSVDFNGNEGQNFVVQNLAVAPVDPKEGQIYYNTAEKAYYVWNGTEWKNTIQEVPEGRDFTTDIEQARDKALADSKVYTDEQIKNIKPAEVNYNQKLADTLREQDPTINRLIKDISSPSEDEIRKFNEPLKTELKQDIVNLKDELLGGVGEDHNTLKELADDIKKFGDLPTAIANLPRKEVYMLSNEPTGVHNISHTRNSEDVIADVYNANKQKILADVFVIDANTIRVVTAAGYDATDHKVVIVG